MPSSGAPSPPDGVRIISAWTKAGIASCVHVAGGMGPQEEILFDIGACNTSTLIAKSVFISHGRVDHIGAAIIHARMKSLQNQSSNYYIPEECHAPLLEAKAAFEKLDHSEIKMNLKIVKPGDIVEISKNLKCKVFETKHRVSSQGYALYRKLPGALLPQFRSLPPQEIAILKNSGVQIKAKESEKLEFVYTGDTSFDGLLLPENSFIFESPILFLECTYLDGEIKKAHEWGHIHLQEIITRASLFHNRMIILCHFSSRYSHSMVLNLLRQKLPLELACRVFVNLKGFGSEDELTRLIEVPFDVLESEPGYGWANTVTGYTGGSSSGRSGGKKNGPLPPPPLPNSNRNESSASNSMRMNDNRGVNGVIVEEDDYMQQQTSPRNNSNRGSNANVYLGDSYEFTASAMGITTGAGNNEYNNNFDGSGDTIGGGGEYYATGGDYGNGGNGGNAEYAADYNEYNNIGSTGTGAADRRSSGGDGRRSNGGDYNDSRGDYAKGNRDSAGGGAGGYEKGRKRPPPPRLSGGGNIRGSGEYKERGSGSERGSAGRDSSTSGRVPSSKPPSNPQQQGGRGSYSSAVSGGVNVNPAYINNMSAGGYVDTVNYDAWGNPITPAAAAASGYPPLSVTAAQYLTTNTGSSATNAISSYDASTYPYIAAAIGGNTQGQSQQQSQPMQVQGQGQLQMYVNPTTATTASTYGTQQQQYGQQQLQAYPTATTQQQTYPPVATAASTGYQQTATSGYQQTQPVNTQQKQYCYNTTALQQPQQGQVQPQQQYGVVQQQQYPMQQQAATQQQYPNQQLKQQSTTQPQQQQYQQYPLPYDQSQQLQQQSLNYFPTGTTVMTYPASTTGYAPHTATSGSATAGQGGKKGKGGKK